MRKRSLRAGRRSCWCARKNRLFFGNCCRSRGAILLCVAASLEGTARGETPLVDRVGATGFVQLKSDSVHSLSPREQALAYWLSQAAIAIHPIIFDQESRFGLRQKRVLEMIVGHPAGVDTAVYSKIVAFTKLFWANRGNHNETTAQKFLPEFTFEQLKEAGLAALQHGARGFTDASFLKELDEL